MKRSLKWQGRGETPDGTRAGSGGSGGQAWARKEVGRGRVLLVFRSACRGLVLSELYKENIILSNYIKNPQFTTARIEIGCKQVYLKL